MRSSAQCLLTSCILAASISLAHAQSPAAAGPTTLPAAALARGGDEIPDLITRLGDVDFRVRRDASNRLRQIGAPALAALKAATESPDPEVRARARQLVRVLEYRPIPGRPRRHGRVSRVTLSIINGNRAIDADDEGREVRIVQGAAGVEITVTGEVDGHPATEVYKARSADDLKSENPEAYALFERFAGRFGNEFDGDAIPHALMLRGNLIIAPQPFQPIIRPGGDDVAALRDQIERNMGKFKVSPQDRQRVLDAIGQIERARQFNPAAQLDNPDREIQRYDEACDGLRKLLGDLKLPDPGNALPPPKSSRLGISIDAGRLDPNGLVVSHVMADSRADRIGLQDDDVIRTVNDKPMHDVSDLRRIVSENPKGLALQVARDGREIKLVEK